MVLNGVDCILENDIFFKNKRLGLVTNHTGRNLNFKSTIDILNENYNLTALFAPEHGVRGSISAGAKVGNYLDEKTNVMCYSLYGSETGNKPTKEMADTIDAFVYDIQDLGLRFYTYISTLYYILEAAKEHSKEVIILDRVNPLGNIIEGNLLENGCETFVGIKPLPVRYGLTCGELANYFNKEYNLNINLKIIKCKNYKKEMIFEETKLPFFPPSPNIPTLISAFVYAGTCLFESTNVSEGRGTTKPFEFIGAPWINGEELANKMNGLNLKAVKFSDVYFEPVYSKYSGEFCSGVQIHITNVKECNFFELGIHLMFTIKNLYPSKFEFKIPKDKNALASAEALFGAKDVYKDSFDYINFIEKSRKDSLDFANKVKEFYLY